VPFITAPTLGPIQPYLLSQCDIDVMPKPLEEQPHVDLIEAQAQQAADAFA
jgi:hypothetical protein